MLMWILFSPIVALTGNLVLSLCLFFFVTNGAELVDLLYISDDMAVDHYFGDGRANSADEKSAGDRSRSVSRGGRQSRGGRSDNSALAVLQRQINAGRGSVGPNSMADSEIEAEMRDNVG